MKLVDISASNFSWHIYIVYFFSLLRRLNEIFRLLLNYYQRDFYILYC